MFYDRHYIGSAAKQLSCWDTEHMGVSVRTGQPHSFIFQHESETGHKVLKFNLKIIGYRNKSSLRIYLSTD